MINCTDLKRMLDDPLLAQTVVVVDVRGPEEVSLTFVRIATQQDCLPLMSD